MIFAKYGGLFIKIKSRVWESTSGGTLSPKENHPSLHRGGARAERPLHEVTREHPNILSL